MSDHECHECEGKYGRLLQWHLWLTLTGAVIITVQSAVLLHVFMQAGDTKPRDVYERVGFVEQRQEIIVAKLEAMQSTRKPDDVYRTLETLVMPAIEQIREDLNSIKTGTAH